MSWIVVLWLLGAGGAFGEVQSTDGILEINKKLISEDDPLSSFLYEGDIVTLATSKFDSKRSKWPWVNGTVQIPYILSDDYDAQQRNVIFEAFNDLENSTCIRFVERKNQRDYISIVPGNGCYSNVGRCGGVQVVSLAYECIRRGKGVVLHELMHVIGFWHEHSRADRDEHVIIHYREIIKGFSPNFCKFQTSNMIVPYDYDSLLHYSGNAFSKSKAPTIEPRNHSANIGQRVKLSKSDILRINKLYRCPQYVPSDDDKLEVVRDLPSGGSTCPKEDMHDIVSATATVFTTSMMADSLTSEEELGSGSLSPTESSKTSPGALSSSSPESKPGLASSSSELDVSDHTVATTKKDSVIEAMPPTSIFPPKTTIDNHIMEENTLLKTSVSANSQSSVTQHETKVEEEWSASGSGEVQNVIPEQDQEYVKETQQQTKTEDEWSASGSGEVQNVILEQHQEYVKENLHNVRKRSLAWKTFNVLSERHPRGIHGNKLTLSYIIRREGSEINTPFCGFEHGFCGWKQSTEDDLDWRLGWGSLDVNTGSLRPEGFHLTLKNRSEGSISGQKALLLRCIVQPSNCVSFWYGSRHSVMGTLNVYITSSGREETLLWSSGGQDHVKWTKAQIMIPPHLLSSNAYVVMEGVIGALDTSTIALDDLYVGQCS